ncbi:MAG: 2OG-Fe(II) oxygenase family protein [Alphaproteobacteria bacterium]
MAFAKTRMFELFPTLVWAHELEAADYEPINRDILAALDAIRAERPELTPTSNWQTPNDLQNNAAFAGLLAQVDLASKSILHFLGVDYENFEVTGCWANVRPKGASHQLHVHPNNYLSGVYYVQAEDGVDSIAFHDPRSQINVISPKFKERNAHNAKKVMINVRTGVMLLFPAWLVHAVEPTTGENLRISVSFNVMFHNFATQVSAPQW